MWRKLLGSTIILCVLLVGGYSWGNANDPAVTRMHIDGNADDWAGRPALYNDPAGDAEAGFLDLTTGYAFVNQDALYLLIETVNPRAPFVQLAIFIKAGHKSLYLQWTPGQALGDLADMTTGFEYIGPLNRSSFALGPALEVRVDLRDLGSPKPESLDLIRILVMVGECCEYPAWHPADEWQPTRSTPVVAEVDPLQTVSNEPQYVLARRFQLAEGYLAEKVFTPRLQAPSHVAIGPQDQIVVTDWGSGDRVFWLHDDGELSTYCEPSTGHSGIVFDRQGNLYVSTNAGELWKVTPDGNTSMFAREFYGYHLDISPSGEIYGTHGDGKVVQRVLPNGTLSTFATGFNNAIEIAVSPVTGEVFVFDMGDGVIYRLGPNGKKTVLVSDLVHEWNYLAFAPDGTLYFLDYFNGLFAISTQNGAKREINWMKRTWANIHPSDFAFDRQGRMVAVDITYNHVVRFDLKRQTTEMLWQGMGNSRALTVDPSGEGLLLGVSHPFVTGQGSVIHLASDGAITTVVDGLLPEVQGIASGADGTLYVISSSQGINERWVSKVHAVTPDGTKTKKVTLNENAYSIAVDSVTGTLWGLAFGKLWYLNRANRPITIPTARAGNLTESLAIAPDGTVYFTAYSGDLEQMTVPGGLYRFDPLTYNFRLVADFTTVNMCYPMGRIGVGKDGNVYWVGHNNHYTPDHAFDMTMLQITPEGGVTVFGRDLPMDPSAITGDPNSTDIYFSSGSGLYRVYKDDSQVESN